MEKFVCRTACLINGVTLHAVIHGSQRMHLAASSRSKRLLLLATLGFLFLAVNTRGCIWTIAIILQRPRNSLVRNAVNKPTSKDVLWLVRGKIQP
jgi:hypothetical protein